MTVERDGQPDSDAPLVEAMAAAISANERYVPTARAQPVRASEAGGCARKIAYNILARRGDIPTPTRPAEDLAAMMIGTELHAGLFAQAMRSLASEDATVSLEDGWELPQYRISGHQDAETRYASMQGPGRITAVECKTINGTGFKIATTGHHPRGPRQSALLQGALAALAKDADELVILYVAREAISHSRAKALLVGGLRRVMAQWTYTREQYTPLAIAEGERLAAIAKLVDADDLPLPELEDGRDVVDPETGLTDDGSYAWECPYCEHQVRHVADWKEARVDEGLTRR